MKFLQHFTSMLSSKKTTPVFEAALAPDQPFYVIGDVHGCDILLAKLLAQIAAEARPETPQIICVGDYIDRGEDSAAVLRRMHLLSLKGADTMTCLLGNHEEMMLDFLDNPEKKGARWLRNGGLQTLASFKIGGVSQNTSGPALVQARDQLLGALGDELTDWLRALPTMWSSGNVTVVHAGADPEVPLSNQSRKTLIWGHAAFAVTPRSDGQWVMHGHTITPKIQAEQGRIGVDTGAYATGRLSAVRISREGLQVLVATH